MTNLTAEPIGGDQFGLVHAMMLLLMAALLPAIVTIVVRPYRARRRLHHKGIAPGALVRLADAEFIVRDVSRSHARLEGEDGSALFLHLPRLLGEATLLARPGEPVPIEIRFRLPPDTDVQLARRIAVRTVTSSARLARGSVSVEDLLISPGEVEFVVRAAARTAGERAALLSELRRGLYLWMQAAGIAVHRVS